jgi:hypothetical protein
VRREILCVVLSIVMPAAIFAFGSVALDIYSGRCRLSERSCPVGTRLNMPWFGYRESEVRTYWKSLDDVHLRVERRHLKGDLLFPLAYGMAFIFVLCSLSRRLGYPLGRVGLLTPVALAVIGDWTENAIQPSQLPLHHDLELSVDPGLIQVSSFATSI